MITNPASSFCPSDTATHLPSTTQCHLTLSPASTGERRHGTNCPVMDGDLDRFLLSFKQALLCLFGRSADRSATAFALVYVRPRYEHQNRPRNHPCAE